MTSTIHHESNEKGTRIFYILNVAYTDSRQPFKEERPEFQILDKTGKNR